jgi:3-hydroxybutyryl-CoA dehydrogenase
MKLWQKVPVVAKDTPGFIVNRIARPFYGEALRILEEGFADPVTIDWAMKEVGGFPMGPFELMDLIGNDVNFTVTKTIFEAFFYDPRYRPSIAQQRMVEAKLLGKKTGHGFYRYGEGAKNPEPMRDEERGRAILMRILSLIINEAVEAVFLGVATPEAIDLAMKNGVNYPHGPLEWADMLGIPTTLKLIEELYHEYGDDRYRPSPLLKKMAREERTFYGKQGQ